MTAATLTLREAALMYGEFLLRRIRLMAVAGHWPESLDACERFERLMANLPPVPQPLVWHGDYS